MQGNKFLYYLIDSNGLSWYVDASGIVRNINTPTPLQFTPDGWQDILIKWERNTTYHGINRTVSNKLSFVSDGAKILRYLYFTNNIEQKIFLVIQKQRLDVTSTEYAYVYEDFYKAEIDLSTYSQLDFTQAGKISVNVADGSFTKYLKVNENTTYEIPCYYGAPGVIPVLLDGVFFKSKINYQLADFVDGYNFSFASPLSMLNQEGLSFGVYSATQNYEPVAYADWDSYAQSNNNFIFTNTKPGTLTLKATLLYKNNGTLTASVLHDIYTSKLQRIPLHRDDGLYSQYMFVPAGATVTRTVTRTITLEANETMNLMFWNSMQSGLSVIAGEVSVTTEDFSIEFESRLDPTLCYCKRPLDIFRELGSKMTDGLMDIGSFNSEILGDNKNLVITCGDAIRNFPNAAIKTNFSDFYSSYANILSAGLSDRGTFVEFERRSKFYDNSEPIDLGIVKSLKISTAKDYYFSSLKAGYPEQNFDTDNGKQEYNTTNEYTTPITRISKSLDITTKYRADSYGIESYRKDFNNLDSEASGSDNSVFILNIEDTPREDGYYHLKRETYSTVTGIDSPETAFNIEQLTPARVVQANGAWLHSMFYNMDDLDIVFQTSDRNQFLSTEKDGITITENANVRIGDLDDPYCLPFIFEIECVPSINLWQLLDENPNRCFQFTYNGNIYKGYNLSVGMAPNDSSPQTFQLLSTADNNLTLLING